MSLAHRRKYTKCNSFFEGHKVTELLGDHEALVLSDSILKHCYLPNHADLCAIGGATTYTVINKIRTDDIPLLQYKLIIVHVGTNDVHNGEGLSFITRFKTLIAEIRVRNPHTHIVFSAVIPRLIDHVDSDEVIKKLNKDVKLWCKQRIWATFYPTYKTMVHQGLPDILGNYWADDGLHLKDRGIRRMSQILKNVVALWRQRRL